MANTQNYINHLLQNTGITPANARIPVTANANLLGAGALNS